MSTEAVAITWDQPGATWDDPALQWDGVIGASPQPGDKRKTMANVKLNLDRLTRAERRDLAQAIHDAMDGNANFPTPMPALVDLQAAKDASQAAEDALTAARTALQDAQLAVEARDAELSDLLRQEGSYVQTESGGDEAIINSAAMQVKEEGQARIMTQVMALDASFGDNEGEVDLNWDSMKGAKSYEIQTSEDPPTSSSWMLKATAPKSRTTIEDLPTGSRCWFRVRAIGANNNGPWSDPATKIVP